MYYSDGGAPESPGVGVNHVHQNAGVLPAGVDHPIFGVGNLVPGNWDPVNHQYAPWEDAWNPYAAPDWPPAGAPFAMPAAWYGGEAKRAEVLAANRRVVIDDGGGGGG